MSFVSGDQFKVSNFEQRLIDLTERFDPFLEKYEREHPSLFRDRIAREAYPLFSGLSQKQNIWHAGLGPQAGIARWYARTAQPNRSMLGVVNTIKNIADCAYK